MGVRSDRAVERREHGGVEYHFCSQRCAQTFDDCPEVYVTRLAT
jgi:YHS domain-containing protein